MAEDGVVKVIELVGSSSSSFSDSVRTWSSDEGRKPMRARMLIVLVAGALALAACGGDDGGNGDGAADGGDGAANVLVTGTDALAFEPSELTAAAGEVSVELTAEEGVNHTFVVEEAGDTVVASADPGQTDTGAIELEAGTYTFYCDVPGHREAGMEGTLTVE